MAELVTLKTFLDSQEAQIAKGVLDQHGITAFVGDENFASASWMHLFALGGLRLRVMDSDLEAAREILEIKGDPLPGGGVESCPKCGSGDIHRAASFLAAALMFVWMAIPFVSATKRRHCRQCGHDWRQEAS